MKSAINQKPNYAKIAQKYNLGFLVLFGSQANGLANEQSDYDIGYLSNNDIDYKIEFKLSENLRDELKCKKIDLVNIRHASPLLAKKALFEGKLLTENIPHSFALEQIRAYHNYVETKALRSPND